MFKLDESNISNIFSYFAPKDDFIGILSIPHSGEQIPLEFTEYLTPNQDFLGKDVDYKVNELVNIKKLNEAGIAVLVSNIHRTCIDLNRAQDICVLNWKKNSHGEKLVLKTPSADVVEKFTAMYYLPYYEMIKSMINALYKVQKKGPISLIDLHSMPSTPTKYHLDINPNQKMQRPDFCVSDIEGLSCSKEYINYICKSLEICSHNINQNNPYFGGHITRHIHAIFENINNIQIEINRKIYMDESKRVLIPERVNKLKPNLTYSIIETFKQFSQ